ncbi:MAG: gliding motility-associated C-terminal domain-containing protein [Chitinophagales bacterium]
MVIKGSIPITFLAIIYSSVFYAQTISGVVNTYAEVTAVSGADITVVSTAGFAVDDHVVIIQMQGADIDETDSPLFGDVIAYNSAGYYEFARIIAISGLVITVEFPLCRTYDIPSNVQLIRIPVYDDVTIIGDVTALDWNGNVGGVVALEVTNTLTFNANINVDGLGFRGGTHCTSFFSCGVDSYFSNYAGVLSCLGGKKGEGIALLTTSFSGSRGKAANGGGGSNSGQHGGAGGGNFGAGGISAFQWTGCFPYDDVWGYGGIGLDYSEDRAIMGGGGGGGHQDNGLEVTDGADGGGIVLITANTIDGLGNAINANGNPVINVTDSEGAGAGGAGGSVILRVNNFSSDLYINQHGGAGGSIESTLWAGTCHGPGGGGGGGYLGISLAALPANVFVDNAGGPPGIITSPGAFCTGTSHGAEAGAAGGVVVDVPALLIYPVVDIGNDTTVCVYLDPFILDAGPGFEYLWSDGSTNQTFEVFNDGIYFVTVSNAFGCADYDTINVIVNDAPPLNLPDTVQFCTGDQFVYDAGAGVTSYLWENGTIGQTNTATSAGIYWCTITNAIGCATTDSSLVLPLWPLPIVDLGVDTIICLGDELILDATTPNSTYLWNNGTTNPTIVAITPGIFSVEVTNEFNCSYTDEINLNPGCGHDIFIPNAFSPNTDGINDIYNVVPFNDLLSYYIRIYDRWGAVIFVSNDLTLGWDGNYLNIPAEIGVYTSLIVYEVETFEGSQKFTLSGTITLLR